MKVVKLNKKLLSLHPAIFLKKIGAINVEQTRVFPSDVYLSKKDYKSLEDTVRKMAKKEMPGATKVYINKQVSWEMLGYGPNESLGDAIKDGFALIDEEAIKKEVEALG